MDDGPYTQTGLRNLAFAGIVILVNLGAIVNAIPAAADVMDIGADGTVTVHDTTGIYGLEGTAPRPARLSPRTVPRPPAPAIGSLLRSAAHHYAIDPALLTAVAWHESRFHEAAISPKGAVGVMQLMGPTAQGLGIDRFDLSQNILGGAAYLRQMLDRYGNVSLALAAYNAGPGAVDSHRGIPPFAETRNYVDAILGSAARPIQSARQSVLIVNR